MNCFQKSTHFSCLGVALAMLLCWANPLHATLLGVENFDYPDGTLHGKNGGTGWESGGSNWVHLAGTEGVVGNAFVSSGSGKVSRSFDAVQATGVVYVGVDVTYNGSFGGDWMTLTLNDNGTDKVGFGMPWSGGQFGITEMGVADNQSGTPIVAGQTYRIVGAIDFGTADLHLWIDPDGTDNAASADYTVGGYASTGSWINNVVLDASGSTTWDNLIVATTFSEVAAVPEPSALLFAGMGALLGLGFRRR